MTVRVYCGHGSNKVGATLLLRKFASSGLPVASIGEDEIRTGDLWRKDTTALVFSGMSVGGFKSALGDDAQRRIRDGVHDGAFDFIGICAGAAFGSEKIKYRMQDRAAASGAQKIENTGLGFFNGLATGPARSVTPLPYTGWTDNLHLVRLRDIGTREEYRAFHWGGPALIPMAPLAAQQGGIFAMLAGDGTPMGVRLMHGSGKATLVSYHPEIDRDNLWDWAVPYIISTAERERLEHLTRNYSDDAFPRFLKDAGLVTHAPSPERKKAAALAAVLIL